MKWNEFKENIYDRLDDPNSKLKYYLIILVGMFLGMIFAIGHGIYKDVKNEPVYQTCIDNYDKGSSEFVCCVACYIYNGTYRKVITEKYIDTCHCWGDNDVGYILYSE